MISLRMVQQYTMLPIANSLGKIPLIHWMTFMSVYVKMYRDCYMQIYVTLDIQRIAKKNGTNIYKSYMAIQIKHCTYVNHQHYTTLPHSHHWGWCTCPIGMQVCKYLPRRMWCQATGTTQLYLKQQCHLCESASLINVIWKAKTDENLKEPNQDYVVDVIKHPNHINPSTGTCVLHSISLGPNKTFLLNDFKEQ